MKSASLEWEPLSLKYTLDEAVATGPLTQATPGAAAWDLCAGKPPEPYGSWICMRDKITTISTGVHLELPEDHFALVLPRSGHAVKRGFTIVNAPGLIDSDYRGEIKVIATLLGPINAYWEVQPGTRIAQLLILPKGSFIPQLVPELSQTERGEGGLGSTGE